MGQSGCRTAVAVRLAVAGVTVALAVLGSAPAAHARGALNGRIAFTSFRDNELGDVWTMNPDGSQLRKLTSGPLYDAQSDWSPDGRRIAFRRGPDAYQRLQIWTMDLYGDDQALLTQGDPAVPAQNTTQPSWVADGRGLLFRATLPPYPDSDIWAMSTDGSDRHLLAHVDGEQLYPSYSPDMSRVAFTTRVGSGSTDRAIYTMNPDGSDLTKVFDAPGAFDSAPAWSPDGTEIAFESDKDGDGEIYVMKADGTDVRQLTNNTIHDEGPAWAPDGTRIAYTSGPDNLNGDVWVMNADGSDPMQLTDSPGRDESPDWQPIPHTGDYTACGDVTHSGAGAYSVKARRFDCDRAKAIAQRWSDDARGLTSGRGLRGFRCETNDAGYDALAVHCVRRRRPHRRALWFLFRGS